MLSREYLLPLLCDFVWEGDDVFLNNGGTRFLVGDLAGEVVGGADLVVLDAFEGRGGGGDLERAGDCLGDGGGGVGLRLVGVFSSGVGRFRAPWLGGCLVLGGILG